MINDPVYNPEHYKNNAVHLQPIELTGRLNSPLGQALQYIIRRKDKSNPIQDLQKAKFWINWYSQKLAALELCQLDESLYFRACDEKFSKETDAMVVAFLIGAEDDLLSRVLTMMFPRERAETNTYCLNEVVQLIDAEIKELEESA